MIKEQRFSMIVNYLVAHGTATLAELAELNGVSIDTVRNDLTELETVNLGVKRVRGGAVFHDGDKTKQPFSVRDVENKEKKLSLAKLVTDLVVDGQSVALNNGTTNVAIAKHLAEQFRHLTVVTNSLKIAQVFSTVNSNHVIIVGGTLDHSESSIYGTHCEQEILNYNIDVAILAINSISVERGITDFRVNEEGVLRAMLQTSRKVYVAADSTKFDRIACVNICPLERISGIITDGELSDDVYRKYTDAGANIIRP